MSRFAQAAYAVQRPEKYVGQNVPYYRSSWELAFMRMCDQHPHILKWASESVKIPYMNPLTNKWSNYVPDFMIQYMDSSGTTHVELVEIKPKNQTTLESAKTATNRAATVVNSAKWTAAQEWCQRKGIRFRVLNEDQIFQTKTKRTPKSRVAKKKSY